ncbi:MAG: hypothetical protein JRE19_12805 [Deltaproteobacteria bacterium]|nr:hypothetical protein [Deltaproteobacteria bacterium]
MKPVQYAIAAFAALFVAACGTDGSGGTAQKCDADSTFAQVQQQIFEARGCTASACHGEAANAGLDLRPESAYASLINVDATTGDFKRVFPAEQDLSILYLKVAANVNAPSLSEMGISGATMPIGGSALSEQDLGLLRAWIRGGAPETDIVDGSEEFASCDLQGDVAPNKIQPLAPPAAGKGVQFYSGGWDVPAEQEGEVCFVTYYDYSDRVPEEFRLPCGETQGGSGRECFSFNNVLLAMDPQSHHSIVEFYVPPDDSPEQWDPMDESWKNWACLGGANAGVTCTPGSDECGERSQCATTPEVTVACISYDNAPDEMGTAAGLFGRAEVRINLATAQEAAFVEDYPPDVYSLMPVKGFVVWDSHAFNLTTQDTSLEQWMNLEFAPAEESVFLRKQIFDARDIFGMGQIDAFTSKEVCTTYTIPQHGQLLTLSSHTHRFGKKWRTWYPPNEPCEPGPDCQPEEREPDYTSFDYADPLYQRFTGDGILSFDSDTVEERTFKYCAVFDNGENNPSEVRRESLKPEAETCDFVDGIAPFAEAAGFKIFTCGCVPEERSCFGGPDQGMACNGDDMVCGEGGICDACPAGGGVTTEEEMFILLGSYYVKTP